MGEAFPYAALPRVSRRELSLGRALRAFGLTARVARLGEELVELTGGAAAVQPRRAAPCEAAAPMAAGSVGAILVPAGAAGLEGGVLVAAEPALTAALVARALRLRSPRIVDAARAPEGLAGAYGAVVHALARRLASGAWRVAAAGPAAALAADLGRSLGALARLELDVTLGAEAFDAGLIFSAGALDAGGRAEPPRLSRARLAALGELPLALPLVVATCLASRAELGALAAGDVLVVPGLALEGPVRLVAGRSEVGVAASLAEGGRLVVGTDPARAPWDRLRWSNEETAMSDNATLEALEDAPVVVRVELGVVELSARAWADLADGDVLTLGKKLGDPAVLRVGGVEVARGELVQVDGEMGVRIRRGGER